MPSQQQGQISAAEIEQYISGIDFPADRDELIDHAESQGAPKEVLDFMGKFPDQEYGSPIDVSRGVSQIKH